MHNTLHGDGRRLHERLHHGPEHEHGRERGHGRGHGFGRGMNVGFGPGGPGGANLAFGPGGPGGPAFGRLLFGRRGPGGFSMRRGEIRPVILAALAEKPMHGYELIQHLEEQSGGRWRPSAGSVYPTLELLADEGLATVEVVDGRRVYSLTDSGRKAAAANPAGTPWSRAGDDREELGQAVRQLVGAVMQIQGMGSTATRNEARRILTDARKQLYRLLAEDEGDTPTTTGTDTEADSTEA